MDSDTFIFCPEAFPDVEVDTATEMVKNLEQLAFEQSISSNYKTCDTNKGLEESLNTLLHEDHNLNYYEIICLVMQGEGNNTSLNEYYFSLEEIAELFEGKITGKILHFANAKVLDLSDEEAQYFLDTTRAQAVSGYGAPLHKLTSNTLNKAFFSLFEEHDNVVEIVEELYKKHCALCQLLDFRLYY